MQIKAVYRIKCGEKLSKRSKRTTDDLIIKLVKGLKKDGMVVNQSIVVREGMNYYLIGGYYENRKAY